MSQKVSQKVSHKIFVGARGGKFYKKNGRKVYISRNAKFGESQFGMDYAVPGMGGLGQGYTVPSFMDTSMPPVNLLMYPTQPRFEQQYTHGFNQRV